MEITQGDVSFGTLITRLQNITVDRASHTQVDVGEFKALRKGIAAALDVSLCESKHSTNLSEIETSDLEIGDIESSVLLTTLRLYPKDTGRESIIDYQDRMHWCESLISSIDTLVGVGGNTCRL